MKLDFTGRKFQLWQYRVSHGEMLVRSPRDDEHPRNADLMFAGVEYLELPRFLPDLEVDEVNETDLARAADRLGKSVERQNVFVLKSQGRRFLVVAAGFKAAETDMDIFDDPFL